MSATLAAPFVQKTSSKADISISAWNLRARVFDSPSVVQHVVGTTQVQNPFADQFDASIPPSSASGNYQVSWSESSVFFLLDTTLHAESLQGAVSTFGHINVTPEVDSILSINGSLQYNMPTQSAASALNFTVSKTNPNQTLFNSSQTRTNFIGPPSGTILLNDSILLPARQSWRIGWGLAIDHFGNAIPGAASDATGHLAFQIHPVPEPAALAPAAVAAMLLIRKRRPHTRMPT